MERTLIFCPTCSCRFLTETDLKRHSMVCRGKKPVFYLTYVENPEEEYKTDKWRRFREFIIKRDGYKCVHCGGSNIPLQVHHIQRARVAPTQFYAVLNVKTLCKDCHQELHDESMSLWEEYDDWGDDEEVLCNVCGGHYHKARYEMCYNCYQRT